MKELERGMNQRTNRLVSGFLVAEFICGLACLALYHLGIFNEESFLRVRMVILMEIPGAIVGLLTFLGKVKWSTTGTRHILCFFMCLQICLLTFFTYSFTGIFALAFPIILAALYPRSRVSAMVSLVMVLFGVLIPPLSLVAGCWDSEYNAFLYLVGMGYDYHEISAGTHSISLWQQVNQIVRFISTQNLIYVGGFAIVGRFIYRQTNTSFENQMEIVRLSETDELTGLLNRNCFERRMEAGTISDGKTITCFYFDANGLHELNNTQGHKAGDLMLQFVGKQIQDIFGKDDSYRVGGDEYVAFAKDMDASKLAEISASLDQKVSDQGYHVAIGYAQENAGFDLQELVKAAEKEMYHAKQLYYSTHDRRKAR